MRLRLVLVCLTLLSSCLVPLLATPVEAEGGFSNSSSPPLVIQKAFRPYGYYSLVGKHPAGFEKFDTIEYWSKEYEQSGPDISERLSGVHADGGVRYRYATIYITRRRFVFNTVRVKGTSYSFSGRFLRTDFVSAEMDFEKPVLVGKLTKYRDGRKAAEANVRLSYFAGT